MNWITLALATSLALAAADFFVKLASGRIPNSLGLLLNGACAFVMGLAWVLWQKYHGVPLPAQPQGVWAGLGVGVGFGLVTIGLYATFGAGAPISLASPVIRLGGLLLAGIAGLLLLREPLTLRYVAGVLLAVFGIYLILSR